MNVYTRATFWGTATTLVLLAAVLALDVWVMSMLPSLQRGLGYLLLQAGMVWLLLKALRLIFPPATSSSED